MSLTNFRGDAGNMLIEFDKIEKTVLKNFNGGEKELSANMYVDDNNKVLYGRLVPGASIGMHKHETSSEIIYILEGEGSVLYDDGKEKLSVGSCHYCLMGHSHSLINDGDKDLVFFAVVPQHRR